MIPPTMHGGRPPQRFIPILLALASLSGLCAPPGWAGAEWQLVDEGACEGPIVSYTMDIMSPEAGLCTSENVGKAAICYTEVCQPHCVYFDFHVEQCGFGADIAKRYTCTLN